ncbi:MmgE/PrpD family protein [Chloroflexota bacterium]
MEISKKLAEFIVGTSIERLPEGSVDFTKGAMIDTVGVALAGSVEPAGDIIKEFVQNLGSKPVAGVLSGGFRTSAPQAGLANGVLAHVLDYDDNSGDAQSKGSCHPSGVFMCTLLPLADELGASGKDIIEAHVVGSEVWAKLSGVLSPPTLLFKGWHPTSALGTLGATAAAAKLLRLNVEQAQNAMGISCSQAAGIYRNSGSMTKSFHMGNAASCGITAAMLAKQGYTSTANVMEADIGYFTAFYGGDPVDLSYVTEKLGNPLDVVEQGLKVKRYPTCSCTHRCIDAMLHLVNTYDIKPDQVKAVDCLVPPQYSKVSLPYDNPTTKLEAKFSLTFVLACAIKNRSVGLAQMTDEEVNDPLTKELMKRVGHRIHPDWAEGDNWPARADIVTVKLKDGREYSHEVLDAKGWPQAPLSDDELIDKYRDCARLVLDDKEMDRSIDLMMNLAGLENVRELMEIVCLIGENN